MTGTLFGRPNPIGAAIAHTLDPRYQRWYDHRDWMFVQSFYAVEIVTEGEYEKLYRKMLVRQYEHRDTGRTRCVKWPSGRPRAGETFNATANDQEMVKHRSNEYPLIDRYNVVSKWIHEKRPYFADE